MADRTVQEGPPAAVRREEARSLAAAYLAAGGPAAAYPAAGDPAAGDLAAVDPAAASRAVDLAAAGLAAAWRHQGAAQIHPAADRPGVAAARAPPG
ncbi:MAG TPA: hypothetical protein PKH63_07180, partial [Actinomycetota bacterium]|nr:hypothetical protein [Actinomycetota bacterium]